MFLHVYLLTRRNTVTETSHFNIYQAKLTKRQPYTLQHTSFENENNPSKPKESFIKFLIGKKYLNYKTSLGY